MMSPGKVKHFFINILKNYVDRDANGWSIGEGEEVVGSVATEISDGEDDVEEARVMQNVCKRKLTRMWK